MRSVVKVNKLTELNIGQGEGETVVKVNKLIELNIGQGEGETKWKGCTWKLLRCWKTK